MVLIFLNITTLDWLSLFWLCWIAFSIEYQFEPINYVENQFGVNSGLHFLDSEMWSCGLHFTHVEFFIAFPGFWFVELWITFHACGILDCISRILKCALVDCISCMWNSGLHFMHVEFWLGNISCMLAISWSIPMCSVWVFKCWANDIIKFKLHCWV